MVRGSRRLPRLGASCCDGRVMGKAKAGVVYIAIDPISG